MLVGSRENRNMGAAMAEKKARQLSIGDKVQRDTGEVVTITRTGRAMMTGATLIEWNGGGSGNWGHLFKGDTVEVLDTRA